MARYFIDMWLSEADYKSGEPAIDTLHIETSETECKEIANELNRDSGCYVRVREENEQTRPAQRKDRS